MECDHAASTEFFELVDARARHEGRCDTVFPGVSFYRMSRKVAFEYELEQQSPFVTVVAQGRKVARLGALELAYAPCSYLVVVGEGTMHGEIVEASEAAPYLSINVELPCDVIAKTLLALADVDASPMVEPAPAFTAPVDLGVKETIVRYVRACDDPVERKIVAPLVLEELVFRLLRCDAAAVLRAAVGREHDADAIQSAMRFMRARSTRPMSVEDVARHVGMSASHFAHRFRAVAQISPMRYLKQLRLTDARALLFAGGVRVAEVATRVGYESASHFTRDFKGYYGAAPAEYVRQYRTDGAAAAAGSDERSAVPDIVETPPAN